MKKYIKSKVYHWFIEPYFNSIAQKTLSILIAYPFSIWVHFSGEEIYVNGTYKDVQEAALIEVERLSTRLAKAFEPKEYKKLSMKQLRLRDLFRKSIHERDMDGVLTYKEEAWMDEMMQQELKPR